MYTIANTSNNLTLTPTSYARLNENSNIKVRYNKFDLLILFQPRQPKYMATHKSAIAV